MRRLADLGSANLRRRRGRAILMAAGVVFGVAMFFGTQVAGATLNRAVHDLFGQVNGAVSVDASPEGASGAVVGPGVTQRVASLPGVVDHTSSLQVPATLADGQAQILFGIDPAAPRLESFPLAQGRLPAAGAPEVAVGMGRAALGSRITMVTATGVHALVVVGLLRPEGPEQASSGALAYTSLTTAQALVGRGDVVDGIGLVLARGLSAGSWIKAHQNDVAGLAYRDPRTTWSALGIIGTGLTFFSLLSLLIGAFLIYLTMSEAVVERTATFGLLRALGATRRQVGRVVTGEVLRLAAIATLVGLVVGGLVGLLLINVFGSVNKLTHTGFVISPTALVGAVVLGIGSALLGARRPAGRASRISPVTAMRGDVVYRTRASRGWVSGLVLIGLALLAFAAGSGTAFRFGGTVALLVGVVLLVPVLLGPLSALAERGAARLAPGVSRLSLLHLRHDRSRYAYTVGLLMAVVAVVIGTSVATQAAKDAIVRDTASQVTADVVVNSPEPIPLATVARVRSTPGVGTVSPIGYGSTFYVDRSSDSNWISLYVVDPSTYFATEGFPWVAGSAATARAGLDAGAVLIPTAVAASLHLRPGGSIVLRTAQGPRPFPVAATFAGSNNFTHIVVVSAAVGRSWFNAGAPDELAVKVSSGHPAPTVAAQLRSELGAGSNYSWSPGGHRFQVVSSDQVKAQVQSSNNTIDSVFQAMQIVGLAVGLLGLANLLAMSVLLRFREIGLLRALGTRRRQLAGMVALESGVLVVIAVLLAIPVGAGIGAGFLGLVTSTFADNAHLEVGGGLVVEVLLAAAVIAGVAAWFPGRRAARVDPVSALRFE